MNQGKCVSFALIYVMWRFYCTFWVVHLASGKGSAILCGNYAHWRRTQSGRIFRRTRFILYWFQEFGM